MRELSNYRRNLKRFMVRAMGSGPDILSVMRPRRDAYGDEALVQNLPLADGGELTLSDGAGAMMFMGDFSALDGSDTLA